MRIAVIGATGVAGRAFVPRAAAAGHTLVTDRVDIFDRGALAAFIRGCDAVVNLATRIGKWEENDRIRREGTAHLIAVAADKIVVQQSVAMLHCAAVDRPQTEDDPLDGYGVLGSAYDLERMFAQSSLDYRIVRGGLFYGPGTGSEQRRLAGGDTWITFVHVDDFAAAVLCVLEHGKPREAYIASDDEPRRVAIDLRLRPFRVTNAKLRALGCWRPAHDGPI